MSDEKSKLFDKNTPVSDLDVEQFTTLMLSITQTKSYIAAENEQKTTERIFKDADGIIAAGIVPFRVTCVADVDALAKDLKAQFVVGKKLTFVVAAALLVDADYRRIDL
jgi:hypothetical protein